MRRIPVIRTGLLGLLLGLLAVVPAASAATDTQVAAVLNAERAANGIPFVGLDGSLSAACALHDAYLAQNPGVPDPHTEIPGRPGYTPAGARVAAESILAMGASFDGGTDPYDHAPFHLARAMDPAVRVIGAAEAHGWDCVATDGPHRRRLPAAGFWTLPGPGAANVATESFEYEFPYTPGDVLGLDPRSTIGPPLYVFAGPPGGAQDISRVRSASLTGPGGPVAVQAVDRSTAIGQALLYPGRAILVPPHPIPAGAYCASVTMGGGPFGLWLRHRWTFTTAGAPGAPAPAGCSDPPPARLRIDSLRVRGNQVKLVVSLGRTVRGRLAGTVQRGVMEGRLHRRGAGVVHGGRRSVTFAGRVPGGIFRILQIWVVLRRTDGGSDELAQRHRPVTSR